MQAAPCRLGEPVGSSEMLGGHLVHRHRGTEDTGTDIGDAGHFEQTLDGSVLAHWAMKQGHHDDRAVGLVENIERIDDRSFDRERFGKELGASGQCSQGPVGADPSTVAVDADGEQVVSARVGGGENVAGGHPGDIVFGGLTAEEHDEAQTSGTGHGPTVVGGARPTDHTPVRWVSEIPRLRDRRCRRGHSCRSGRGG